MNETQWLLSLKSLLAGVNIDMLLFAAVAILITLLLSSLIARYLDKDQDSGIEAQLLKCENLSEQLRESQEDAHILKKQVKELYEHQNRQTTQHKRLKKVILERKISLSRQERLVKLQAEEITRLQNSMFRVVELIDDVDLEAIKVELHLARLAIRSGRHQMEELTRIIRQEQSRIDEAEAKIEE